MAMDGSVKVSASIDRESFPIAGQFRISRGSKTVADVIKLTLNAERKRGVAECVPYPHYGESFDGIGELLDELVAKHTTYDALQSACTELPAGAARNALDCALWDLRCKMTGQQAHQMVCTNPPRPISTAMTISLDTPENMANAARRASDRSVLKIKLGGQDDIACMHAVVANAANSDIIIDANEAWTGNRLATMMREASLLGVALIEQPLPADDDDILARIPHPVPICADESVHTTDDLDGLMGKYDFVNIKLDKTGGLTEAMKMRDRAWQLGFGIMVGCMVGTSLAMAPAVLLAQDAEYVDLDGPLLLSRDRTPALHYFGDVVSPPERELWG